ncbi:MAG: mismatch-specific DNA-glycosylase [Rudaea sp.]
MLPDYLAPNLDIVFVGINPGTYSDRVGHYFARKTNLFWTALYESGLVPVPLKPEDDSRVLEFGYGLTDIVKRATPNTSHVAGDEFKAGARVLKDKLMRLTPRLICFVGLVGYRQGFDPKAVLGPQEERWGTSQLFIVPSTSPRNAHYRPETVQWFVRLKNYSENIEKS